ncbi:MAG: branched-chain amino acid ABC transporter ATP-binding protein/permease [Bauldia sp.]|uniref:branched-chain amino acid ABC transporter ATP-binding protein/permease n=1 Tax=Bauldia sp. TaxID=2575872 RepID=UPI001DC18972|nr:branched-chain amino acid ABC transporter ATP-binding protein/permease [Bauldia sp.]MCB1497127.1 branched-chain amino acid ABC transporter ATP-binding protein/permease [Bauldia sp.]
MSAARLWQAPVLLLLVAALAVVPLVANGYYLALGVGMLSYIVLATAWALFSGPTRYISLATAAFFGIGAYTMAVLSEAMPVAAVIVVAAVIGVAVALVVGLATLRLRGIFFVIFTFGLAELIRQIVTWYEVKITRTVGRYIFLDIGQEQIYWQLLALAVLVFVVGWLIGRSRLGLALRVIGDDETVARHVAIDTTRAKLVLFAISAAFMSVTGAVMAPRWTYIDPAIAFNPMISFQVVIMALLGGAGKLYGPLLGAVPLVLLFEVINANFPNHFAIVLGVVFIVIVYFLPGGVAGLYDRWRSGTLALPAAAARSHAAPGSAMLQLVRLRKAFGGLVAVNDLDLGVEAGEILGLIGPNGSGKTTALNLISGALKPDSGEILYKGRPIAGLAANRIARLGIARTFQIVRVLEHLSCTENIVAGLAFRPRPAWGDDARRRAEDLLNRVGLAGRGDVPAGDLNYIDQKRLELARALALEPELLLLDEWLAGLNPSELAIGIDLVQSLRDEGLTIIMVEHVMDAIRSLCDRCVVMNTGIKIADGPPSSVLSEPEVVAAYLGGADA